MSKASSNKVVSVGVSKEAALYSDRVSPDDLFITGLDHVGALMGARENVAPLTGPDFAMVARSLLPNADEAEELIDTYSLTVAVDLLLQLQWAEITDLNTTTTVTRVLNTLNKRIGLKLDPAEALAGPDPSIQKKFAQARTRILRQAGFADAPAWVSEAFLDASASPHEQKVSNFVVTLRGMEIIDPAKLSWEQICEFRKDETSTKALRELRLFFNESYADADPTYVSDKLLSIEDRYNSAARLWKFETIHKSLSVAFTNQSGLMASVGTLSAAVAGAPLVATAAAAAVFPIGKVALEFGKALIDSAKTKSDNPTKYLTHLRRLRSDNG